MERDAVVPRRARSPLRPEIALARAAIVAVFVAMLARTWSDPDLWGHLRFGADIVAAGAIPHLDPYAFTSRPAWVNQSWLANVGAWLLWTSGGARGLIAAKAALLAATLGLAGVALGRAGARGPLRSLLLFLLAATLSPAIPTLRPQLLSLLLFAALLQVEVRSRTRPAWLLAAPAILVPWANVHGAWLLGLVELAIWGGAEMLTPPRSWRRTAIIVAAGAAAGLATLATPWGVALWEQLWTTRSASLRDVGEWRGLLETASSALVIWLAVVGLAATAVWRHGARPADVLVVAWLAWSSWQMRRLLPFFGVATVTLLAPALVALGRGRLGARDAASPTRRGTPLVAAAPFVLVIALAGVLAVRSARCIRFDTADEADPRAGAFIAANHLRGRMLTYSDWGQYVIWHFAPDLRVSMDGRREFAYAPAELARHNAIYWNAPGATADVEALAPDWIWLPATLPVLPALDAAGWTRIFATPRSVVFARAGRTPPDGWTMPPDVAAPVCFPDF